MIFTFQQLWWLETKIQKREFPNLQEELNLQEEELQLEQCLVDHQPRHLPHYYHFLLAGKHRQELRHHNLHHHEHTPDHYGENMR